MMLLEDKTGTVPPDEPMSQFWQWWREQCRQSDERSHQVRLQQPYQQRFKEPEPRKAKRSKKAKLLPRR